MIDIPHAYEEIAAFFRQYSGREDPGYDLKIRHTYHVAANARHLAELLQTEEEDFRLAELIGLLHDIGRFEELHFTGEFNSARFDHAAYGVKMLFEEGMIRRFINTDLYDSIIHDAILYHSVLRLPEDLDEKTALHAKIIRDADKLDNFRVKIEEPVENIFPGRITTKESVETSYISEPVLNALLNAKPVNISDRITPLDYFVTIIGFYFDLNFKEARDIVHEENLIRRMVYRFDYKDPLIQDQIDRIVGLTDA